MVLRFGQVELDEDAYELRRDGVVQHVEPKVLDLLLYLAHHRERLVTKDELLDRVWPGVVVAESALTRAMSLARAAVGDTARGQTVIETVSGRGYRFRAPVEAGAARPAEPTSLVRPRLRRRLVYVAAGLLALLVAGWMTWPAAMGLYMDLAGLADPPEIPPLPEQPSVAVLPFADFSPDARHAYLADGIADELTAGLGRFREIFVIARSSAFMYRGPEVDAKRVGRELGVRYVVEGSVRASDVRAVVTAQLVSLYDQQGRYPEAQALAKEIRLTNPDFTAELAVKLDPRHPDAEAAQQLSAQLRRAGIP